MKKKTMIILLIVFVLIQVGIIFYALEEKQKDIPLLEDYVAIFKGETSQTVYSTYIYKKKKKNKVTYHYINTVSTISNYESVNEEEKILKKGKITKLNKIYEIAKKNNAFTYVKYKDGKIYTIEEIKKKLKG